MLVVNNLSSIYGPSSLWILNGEGDREVFSRTKGSDFVVVQNVLDPNDTIDRTAAHRLYRVTEGVPTCTEM